MKTIFIVITRGFIIRNILRSGVLDHLKRSGCKVVIFLQILKGEGVPEYLKKEFADENVIIESIGDYKMNIFFDRSYRFFARWSSLLVNSKSTLYYIKYKYIKYKDGRGETKFFKVFFEKLFFILFSRIHFLKRIFRFIEERVFISNFYSKYFDKYRPDIVFSTSIISVIDMAFMKEAKRRNVKTVSMTKGWDHASRSLYRFIPDKIIVQNDIMKDYLLFYQKIREEKVSVCGFPQFDWYPKKELLVSREEFMSSLGFDQRRKLIVFGSEGPWSPNDDNIAGLLAESVGGSGKLSVGASLLIRPYFADLKTNRFNKFFDLKNIKVDNSMVYREAIPMNWDPNMDEVIYFVNLMYHMDVLVNIASTLTLDACCFDKPIIAVNFGCLYDKKSGKDISNVLNEDIHYQDVLKTGAVDLVSSEQELLASVNNYLLHPEYKRAERKVLLDNLCYRVDGNSSKRIADEILSML